MRTCFEVHVAECFDQALGDVALEAHVSSHFVFQVVAVVPLE